VGFLGNPGLPSRRRYPELYEEDGYHWFPVLEIDSRDSASPGIYGYSAKSFDIGVQGAPGYLCPADIPEELRLELVDLTRKASQALDACDISRVDFRLGADGNPYLMEINTLPGLNSGISDICIMAAVEGMEYQTLITEILYLAAERYEMPLIPDREVWIASGSVPTQINQKMTVKPIPVIKERETDFSHG
jgi:D-alanine-D-alanine ligase